MKKNKKNNNKFLTLTSKKYINSAVSNAVPVIVFKKN
jgi:hypothetical protein